MEKNQGKKVMKKNQDLIRENRKQQAINRAIMKLSKQTREIYAEIDLLKKEVEKNG